MKRLNQLNKNTVKILSGAVAVAVLGLNMPLSSLAAGAKEDVRGRGRESREQIEREAKSGEVLRGKMDVMEISQRLSLSATDLVDFFRAEKSAGRMGAESQAAWNEIFQAVRSGNSMLAETVNSYISLKKSGLADNFHLNERDIADINKNWTATQKANFGKALRRAAEIAKDGKGTITTEEAFEKALDEMGILEKYRQGCRN